MIEILEIKIKTLTMRPSDWSALNHILDSDEYHAIVMDYQRRENDALPECNAIFGLCRYFVGGRCNCPNRCKNKIHVK